MACLGCQCCEDEATPMVTLRDGSTVCSSCPEWMMECEARHLLSIPLETRRAELAERQKKRGAAAVEALKTVMMDLHNRRQSR